MSDEEDSVLSFRLTGKAAKDMEAFAKRSGYTPNELVTYGVGIFATLVRERSQGHRVCITSKKGARLKEVILPEPRAFENASGDDSIRKILDEVSLLSSRFSVEQERDDDNRGRAL